MRAYQAVRAQGEVLLRESGIETVVLRPWYVLGPGHRWPVALIPLYAFWERLPSTRETAQRLALVTLPQMLGALVQAVELAPDPSNRTRLLTAIDIRLASPLRPRRSIASS